MSDTRVTSSAPITPAQNLEYKLAQLQPELTQVPPDVSLLPDNYQLQWDNRLAIQRVAQAGVVFNQPADMHSPLRGGAAVWINPPALNSNLRAMNFVYDKLEIRDINYLHYKPVFHSDFSSLSIRMALKPDKAQHLAEITDSVYYYPLGQILTATCGELEANIASMAIVKLYNHDHISLMDARERYNAYVKLVLGEFFANEKEDDWAEQPTPVRDLFEQYIFDDMALQELENNLQVLQQAQNM